MLNHIEEKAMFGECTSTKEKHSSDGRETGSGKG